MALAQTVEKLDDIPEALREHYVERQGKWHLDTESDPRLVTARREASEERRKRQETERQLQALNQEIETLKSRRGRETDEDETDAKRLQRQREASEQQLRELHTQVQNLQGQLTQTSGNLTRERIGTRLRASAQKVGLLSQAVEDAVRFGMDVFREDTDGKIAAFEGQERLLGKSGEDLTMDEWLAERRQDRPHWFTGSTGSGNTGGGAQHQGGGMTTTRARPRRRSEMTPQEKAQAITDMGQEEYLKLPW